MPGTEIDIRNLVEGCTPIVKLRPAAAEETQEAHQHIVVTITVEVPRRSHVGRPRVAAARIGAQRPVVGGPHRRIAVVDVYVVATGGSANQQIVVTIIGHISGVIYVHAEQLVLC